MFELGPPQILLALAEQGATADAGETRLLLGERVQVIQPANEQQIGDLLDDLQRVRDASRPKRIPDPVDLAIELTGYHCCTHLSAAVGDSTELYLGRYRQGWNR